MDVEHGMATCSDGEVTRIAGKAVDRGIAIWNDGGGQVTHIAGPGDEERTEAGIAGQGDEE